MLGYFPFYWIGDAFEFSDSQFIDSESMPLWYLTRFDSYRFILIIWDRSMCLSIKKPHHSMLGIIICDHESHRNMEPQNVSYWYVLRLLGVLMSISWFTTWLRLMKPIHTDNSKEQMMFKCQQFITLYISCDYSINARTFALMMNLSRHWKIIFCNYPLMRCRSLTLSLSIAQSLALFFYQAQHIPSRLTPCK